MSVLIVYDSFSPNKNTEKIAIMIQETLTSNNLDVNCFPVGSVDKTKVKNYDCVLVGSPTMAWSATDLIKQFLESFNAGDFAGKVAAAFDTRIESRLSGQAAKGIQERLKEMGFKIIAPPLAAYVEGSARKNDFMLKEGQIEKAKQYAQDLAKVLKS